ncbi:hypothetical protein B0H66DRAFT_162669 [Apodospora peruviana]|uniref:BZIP domain-containing protein n=1 Tax=Apodospora peruviana TaxID=516989 RepID=A0AAE0IK48_9PEZI|nr:hypothetical protein B0H66DRAFT_162669 [Apodospora peruviana]
MDTPSNFLIDDFIDSEEPVNFHHQGPDHDAEDGGGGGSLQSFQGYNSQLDMGESPTSGEGRILASQSTDWGDFAEQFGPMVADQKSLFVNPGMCEGKNDNDEIQGQMQALSDNMSQPSTRRTSSSKSDSQRTSESASALTDITPPDQENPLGKGKRKRARKESDTGEEEQKRIKFLERNRIAASKCREKKKQYVSELEDTRRREAARHHHLVKTFHDLVTETNTLKHTLMAHGSCNDPNIDRWLRNEARRFVQVQTSNEPFGQAFTPNFGQNGQAAIPTGSPCSRNASISSAYQPLQGVQVDAFGPGERQDSLAYSQGSSLYTSPTDQIFPSINTPALKTESDINYDHMPDTMFSPGQTTSFGGG